MLPKENNNVPSMPGLPAMNTPVVEDNPMGSTEEKENVNNEVTLEKPIIDNPSSTDSVISVSNMSASGIEVIATRKGFYNQTRVYEGQEFKVKDFDALGEWMKCIDPVVEKKRVQFFKDKKAKK